MKTLEVGNHVFEIVDSIPKGYVIWNIGRNMKDGYLPLCEVYEGTYHIKVETLKAIKLEKAQEVLEVVGCVKNVTPEELKRYYNRYKDSKNAYTRDKANKTLNAANILSEVKFD